VFSHPEAIKRGKYQGQMWWYMPVILFTREIEIRRKAVQVKN
jgi:hypothetical protein